MDYYHNNSRYALTNSAILIDLGAFLKQQRLLKNLTQNSLAQKAGINRSTLSDIEHGRHGTLLTFIQVLRALERFDLLNVFSPQQIISPIMVAEAEAKQRKRASRASKKRPVKNIKPSQW
jgi:transcriptional regulator with XRE-family HTH domain